MSEDPKQIEAERTHTIEPEGPLERTLALERMRLKAYHPPAPLPEQLAPQPTGDGASDDTQAVQARGMLSTPEHPEPRAVAEHADGSATIAPDFAALVRAEPTAYDRSAAEVARRMREQGVTLDRSALLELPADPTPEQLEAEALPQHVIEHTRAAQLDVAYDFMRVPPQPRPSGEELALFGAMAKLPVRSLHIARVIESFARVGLWPALAAVADLLDSEDGQGKHGDRRWRELSAQALLHKFRGHVRAMHIIDRDADSGRPPSVHVASRALMLVALECPRALEPMPREPVIIESPLAGCEPLHLAYLDACTRDALRMGWTPYASHRQLSRALDDTLPEEREQGISAGLAMRDAFHALGWHSVFYQDLGMSSGMQRALDSMPRGTLTLARMVPAHEWPRILAEAEQDRFFEWALWKARRNAPALEGVELALAAREVFRTRCLEAWTREHRETFARDAAPPQTERSRADAAQHTEVDVRLSTCVCGTLSNGDRVTAAHCPQHGFGADHANAPELPGNTPDAGEL